MSTVILNPSAAAPIIGARPIAPQRFSTLLAVELRKLVDTRSGRWLLGLLAATCVFLQIWLITHGDFAVNFHHYSNGTVAAIAFVVPVIGLLAMTSEWTQRTALTTFTLSPRRLRVIGAKFAASMILSFAMLVFGLLVAAAGLGIGGLVHPHAVGGDIPISVAGDLRAYVVFTLAQVVMASAFGALAGQTVVALGIYLAAPTVWAAVGSQLFGSTARWFDIWDTYSRISSDHPGDHIAQTVTSVAVWVVIPAVIGLMRSVRREVK